MARKGRNAPAKPKPWPPGYYREYRDACLRGEDVRWYLDLPGILVRRWCHDADPAPVLPGEPVDPIQVARRADSVRLTWDRYS